MLLMYAQNHAGVTAVAQPYATVPPPIDHRHCGLRITFQRLMEASERQLESIAHGGSIEDMQVAQRILESTQTFCCWENEYAQLMRRVAAANAPAQKRALLSACLSLLHRRSLFQYLRDYHVHDRQRELLLLYFHSGNNYARAMVMEHGNYLRSAASYLCSTFLGLRLMHDAVFAQPLCNYETLYTAYFATYCKLLTSQMGATSNQGKLVYKLKCQLGQRRQQLLNGVQSLH